MKDLKPYIRRLKQGLSHLSAKNVLRLAVAVGVVVLIIVLVKCGKPSLGVSKQGRLVLTPTQIKQIKDIGEWEFLTIEDEEVVDTTASSLLSTRELVRLYFGTLRLGIDLSEAADNWIVQRDDTIVMTLPPVKLLSEDFIDEARTQTFYEDGSWEPVDHARMYAKAKRMMKRRCLTDDNFRNAEASARTHFTQMLTAMGFANSRISFLKRPAEKALLPLQHIRKRVEELLDEY